MKALAIFLCLLALGAAQDDEIDEIIEFDAVSVSSTIMSSTGVSSTGASTLTDSSSTTEIGGSTSTVPVVTDGSSTATISEGTVTTPEAFTGSSTSAGTESTTEPKSTLTPVSGATDAPTEPVTVGTGSTEAPVSGKTQATDSPSGSTSEPVTEAVTSTQKPSPTPMQFTTIKLGNKVTIYDQRAVLQEAVDLQAAVQNMTIEMNTLAGQLSANSSLGPQMTQMQANATALQSTLNSIISQMNSLSANATACSKTLVDINSKFTCMADSECVVGPTDCPLDVELPLSGSPKLLAIGTNQTSALCRREIPVVLGTTSVVMNITANIVRNGSLIVTTENDKQVLTTALKLTKSGKSNIEVTPAGNATKIVLTYFAAETASLNINISYFNNACYIFGCENNGTCYLDPQYSAHCACASCKYGGDHCEQINDACTRNQKANCNTKYGSPNCIISDTDCSPLCSCDGTKPTTVPCPTTASLLANYGKFENAVAGDSIFKRFVNWMN